jgi:hypothetical protein
MSPTRFISMALIPDSIVARVRYQVVLRTLDRWDKRPELRFPKPHYINGRKYRDQDELDAWDRGNALRISGKLANADPAPRFESSRNVIRGHDPPPHAASENSSS